MGTVCVVSGVRRRRVVACVGDDADFVFHLHHDHGVRRARRSPSTRRIRAAKARASASRLASLNGERRSRAGAVVQLHARESLEVALHPVGRIARPGVLPAAEPQEHEPQIVRARVANQPVDQAEVELALGGFEQGPGDRRQHGVEMHRGQPRPDRLHVVEARRRVVEDLAAQRQERLAVDDQLGRRAAFFQMRNNPDPA